MMLRSVVSSTKRRTWFDRDAEDTQPVLAAGGGAFIGAI